MSDVDICNSALRKVSCDAPISAMSDRTKEARILRSVWMDCLTQTLSMHAWPFATRVVAMSLQEQDPFPGWAYRYQYPGDCLNALAVCTLAGIRDTTSAVFAGRTGGLQSFQKVHGDQDTSIVTDLEGAYLIYVTLVEDTARFTPMFKESLACRIGAEIAPALAGELGFKLQQKLRQDLVDSISIASTNEYNEARAPVPNQNTILGSRTA
jgi:hypothetical protein